MVELSFSFYDLEYFLLVLVRVSCFVFVAPFFSMNNTPARVRITLSVFISLLLYVTLAPADMQLYRSLVEYAVLVGKEAVTGLLLGFSSTMCTAIVNFAGSIADMETGLSMVTLMDPTSRQSTSITGAIYQYMVMLMLIATGMYRYLLGALADSFLLIPVGGAQIRPEKLLDAVMQFLVDYIVIGFRICLPIFCVILILNAILGVLAKVSPQINMFAVGIQLKILVGLSVLFFTIGMLPDAANFIFSEMKKVTVSIVEGII